MVYFDTFGIRKHVIVKKKEGGREEGPLREKIDGTFLKEATILAYNQYILMSFQQRKIGVLQVD